MRGIVGGMFDPIHFGHYKPALELMSELSLSEIRLIPCGQPPHRDAPEASAQHRWDMVNIVADGRRLLADSRELDRTGPSYMVDTLASLKAESDSPVCLFLGDDALLGLPRWHRAQEILDLCHIVVMARVEAFDSADVPDPWREHCTQEAADLQCTSEGAIYLAHSTRYNCASRDIRAQVQAGEAPRYCLPGSVWSYIRRHHLYGA